MCLKFGINILKKSELIYKDTFNNVDFNLIEIFAKNCLKWVILDLGCQMYIL